MPEKSARLAGKAAIVTGAGQGIGRAIVDRLLAEGAQVAALDIKPSAPDGVLAVACDVTSSDSVRAAVAEARKTFGRLDIAVSNAGIGKAPGDGSDEFYAAMAQAAEDPSVHVDQLIHMEDRGWQAVMAVNIDGAFRIARETVRVMAADNRGGSIINVSSTSAQSGEGSPHYCASKAAVIGLTRQLARELAKRKIRVNAVAPGPTNTPIMGNIPEAWIKSMEAAVPLGRLADPKEIAAAVAFLASDDASFVTGSVLVANGGSYFF